MIQPSGGKGNHLELAVQPMIETNGCYLHNVTWTHICQPLSIDDGTDAFGLTNALRDFAAQPSRIDHEMVISASR